VNGCLPNAQGAALLIKQLGAATAPFYIAHSMLSHNFCCQHSCYHYRLPPMLLQLLQPAVVHPCTPRSASQLAKHLASQPTNYPSSQSVSAPPACCAESLLGLICDQLHLDLPPDAMRTRNNTNFNKVILRWVWGAV
jgi:hypothetical protein